VLSDIILQGTAVPAKITGNTAVFCLHSFPVLKHPLSSDRTVVVKSLSVLLLSGMRILLLPHNISVLDLADFESQL